MLTSFSPIVSVNARVLILGTMPGKRSLELQQYYAHSRNSFWYIMGEICGFAPDWPYVERVAKLTESGIALWDVLQHCERESSLDSDIVAETETPNDFVAFLAAYPHIQAIFFNGKKAEKAFRKRVLPMLPPLFLALPLTGLPSTSPANTRMTRDEKVRAWRVIQDFF